MLRMLSLGGAVALAVFVFSGCYTEPAVGYAEVTSGPPAEIDTYPSVVYEGRPVYFDGGRWWYRDGARWAYYRNEPAELHRRRPGVRARPARHEEHEQARPEERR
jgi:hypothetical protein